MTMDISAEHVAYLSQELETNPVTYRTASRALSVHVTQAKKLLFSYYNANKSRVQASFFVSGSYKGLPVLKVFESEVDLAENRHLFVDSVACVHVYGLTLTKNAFSAAEIAMAELRHPLVSTDLGITKGPALVPVETGKTAKSAQKPEQRAERSRNIEKAGPSVKQNEEDKLEKSEAKAEKPKLVYQSRKQQPKASVLSNYVSRKSETRETPAKRQSAAPQKLEYKSRKLEANQPKERVVMSNFESGDAEKDEVPKTKQPSHAELQNLFMDDFSDDEPLVAEKAEPIIVELEKPVPQEETPAPAEDDMEMDPVQENSILLALPLKTTDSMPEEPVPEVTPETTVDDDGYFTLYKQTPAKPAPKEPKPPAKPQETKARPKSGTGKKQTSLMNFFGKR